MNTVSNSTITIAPRATYESDGSTLTLVTVDHYNEQGVIKGVALFATQINPDLPANEVVETSEALVRAQFEDWYYDETKDCERRLDCWYPKIKRLSLSPRGERAMFVWVEYAGPAIPEEDPEENEPSYEEAMVDAYEARSARW